MPFQLRSGNTGIPLVPNVDGVTLIWSAALQAWDFGAAGGAIEPLENTRFVDGSTTVPLADQDGSIAAPFSTVQAALDALVAALARPVVLICPGDYSAEVLVWAGETDIQLSSFSQAARGFQAGFVDSVRIGSFECDFGVSLTGIQHGSIDGGFGTITLQNTTCNGPVTLASDGGLVVGFNAFVGGAGNVINASNVRFNASELQEITMNVSGTLVEVTDTNWQIGATVEFTGAAGSLRLDSMTEFYFDAMGGAASVVNGSIEPLKVAITNIAFANLPSAADGAGRVYLVTDGFDGGPCLSWSDGSDWFVMGTRMGKLTAAPEIVTIAAGVVTANGPDLFIDTEGGAATDDVDTINGTVDGQIIRVSAALNNHTVVLKDGTGNMSLAGDITLDNDEDLVLLINYNGAIFQLAPVSNNGA